MARLRKCKHCGSKKEADEGFQTPVMWFCCGECAYKYGNKLIQTQRDKAARKAKQSQEKKEKAARAKHRERKKEVMSRSQWYDKLQALVNQYVRFRDLGKPCPTCGRNGEDIAWDAGHFIPQKGYDPRRFDLTNNHRQCVYCNQYGGGKRAEYREWMINKYGLEHVEHLECEVNHKPLKEQFPVWQDIENEIKRYRKLLRDNGITPCR